MKRKKVLLELRNIKDVDLHVEKIKEKEVQNQKYVQTRWISEVLMAFFSQILCFNFFEEKYCDLEDIVFRMNLINSEVEKNLDTT